MPTKSEMIDRINRQIEYDKQDGEQDGVVIWEAIRTIVEQEKGE